MTDPHNSLLRRSNSAPRLQRVRTGLKALGIGLLLGITPIAATADSEKIRLPELGDSTSGVVSRQHEKKLGQMWLRMFRSQVKPLPMHSFSNMSRKS